MTGKRKPSPAAGPRPQAATPGETTAFGAGFGDLWKSVGSLPVPLEQLAGLQADYLKQATAVWNGALGQFGQPGAATPAPPVADRRFASTAWQQNPAAAFAAQMYLLNARTLQQMADSVQGDEKTKARVRFAVQQWIDAAAPSNFLAFNPDALQKAIETKGESIAQGVQHLLEDLKKRPRLADR